MKKDTSYSWLFGIITAFCFLSLWSTHSLPSLFLVENKFPAILVAALRPIIGASTLILICRVMKVQWMNYWRTGMIWPATFLAINFFSFQLAVTESTSSAMAMLSESCDGPILIFIDLFYSKRTRTLKKILLTCASILSLTVIMMGFVSIDQSAVGWFACGMCLVSWVLFTITRQRFHVEAGDKFCGLAQTTVLLVWISFPALIIILLSPFIYDIGYWEVVGHSISFSMLYLGVGATAIAYLCYNISLNSPLGLCWTGLIFSFTGPLTLFFGSLVVNDPISPTLVNGSLALMFVCAMNSYDNDL